MRMELGSVLKERGGIGWHSRQRTTCLREAQNVRGEQKVRPELSGLNGHLHCSLAQSTGVWVMKERATNFSASNIQRR